MQLKFVYQPILRQKVQPVTVFDQALQSESDQMLEVMRRYNGIGLAANQVGLDQQLIVMEYVPSEDDKTPAIPRLQLANPRVIKSSKETEIMTEGCLSLPGLELPVERPSAVVVEGQNLRGEKVTIKAKGLFARVLQHEIDHLHGILFTDRATRKAILNDIHFAKVVFFGSDDFSLPVLVGAVEAGLQVVAAICETDKRAGRGTEKSSSPVKEFAESHGIAVFSPDSAEEITPLLEKLQPDLILLASYGKILPEAALAIPPFGAINIHPSLLPAYRGATPIQSAILDGRRETGVTVMKMEPRVDAGAILAQQPYAIGAEDTTASLKVALSRQGSSALLSVLPTYFSGLAELHSQDPQQVTKTKKLTREMGEIDWSNEASVIDRQIRAFTPWPGTYTWMAGKRVKIIRATVREGKILPLEVQLEGKTAVDWASFVRGYERQLTRESWYGKIYR